MIEPIYLFLLTLNNAGSTAVIQFLNTSKKTSLLWPNGEGQWLPEVVDIMRREPWNPQTKKPWDLIKKEYLKKWNQSSEILLEKSPPNLVNGKEIQEFFLGVRFIVMNRNPYAQCSSCYQYFLKHSQITDRELQERELANLANKWLFKSKYQKWNLENLDRTLLITYEDFVKDLEATKNKILEFCPELEDLTIDTKFQIKNYQKSEIKDFNQKQIDSLTNSQIEILSRVFKKNKSLLDFFSYNII
jgi:hypothetical protein